MKRRLGFLVGALLLLPFIVLSVAHVRHDRGIDKVEQEWEDRSVTPLVDFGSSSSLSILPLVDWHTEDSRLQGEAGVSYLVRTEHQSVLFDTGFNRQERDPAPLAHNMRTLGIGLDAVDTLFISHLHPDHVGGFKWFRDATFSIGNGQPDLADRGVFVPVEMTYPGSRPTLTREPTAIGIGIASTGVIPRQLFAGRVEEQALAVRLRDRGLVLVVGCGHQTLQRLLERALEVFDEPIYGVVGGLHYPVPEGRGTLLGIDVQRTLGSGSGPFRPVDDDDVDADIELLQELDVRFIGLGGHDSSDEVIQRFEAAFADRFHPLRVGRLLEIG